MTRGQLLYHRGWYRAVEIAGASLNCSLLAKHADNADRYVVNLDPQVIELLHEAKHLQKMDLDVHETALALCQQEAYITSVRESYVSAIRLLPCRLACTVN